MSDLIDRQATVEALLKCGEYYNGNNEASRGVAQCIGVVYDLPTIERKTGKWIPCSEGLPKKDGRYQVTRHDYVTQTNFVDILWYEEGVWWNRQSIGDYAVTAWMPLSEPYKEEQE